MAIVIFSSPQRRYVNEEARIEIDAVRVDQLIQKLYTRYPDLAGKLDGAAVSIDGDLHSDGKFQPLGPESEVHFVGAIAGG